MKKTIPAIIAALAVSVSLAACTKAPADRFKQLCTADKEKSEHVETVCSCIGENLKTQLSEEQYAQLVDFMQAKQEGKKVSEDVMDGAIMGALFSASVSCSSVVEEEK